MILGNLKKKNCKQTWQQSQQIAKKVLNVEDSNVKNIQPCKMKKTTKYITTVKSIRGVTTEKMIYHK